MAAKKNKLRPDTTSANYDKMLPRWLMLDAVLGGTETMREAGPLYLPQHQEESAINYAQRLQQAVLENHMDLTLNGLSAKPFKEDVKINDDVPALIQESILPDVDLQGTELGIFCQNWFKMGLHKGFAHVLVDMPRPREKPNGEKRTLEDDKKENLRPYWVLIRPEHVIYMESTIVDGREVLTHVRIREYTTVRDGFAEVIEERIRVLDPGTVTMYKKHSKKDEWEKEDEWVTGLDFIPMVTFYSAEKEGTALCKPPLLDLAYLNVSFWQSNSDQRHVLTVARFPIMAGAGVTDEEGKLRIGPNQFLTSANPQGKYYYVEHTGAAIESGANDLKTLREAMSAYGAEFLKVKPGDQTATARALDSAEATTPLGGMVMQFQDKAAVALDFTATWLKIKGGVGGTIELAMDFEYSQLQDQGLDALEKARAKRDISRETYLDGLKKRGVLSEDFDPVKDAELLAEETELLMQAQSDLDPGSVDADPPTE